MSWRTCKVLTGLLAITTARAAAPPAPAKLACQPCAVSAQELETLLRRYRRSDGVFDTAGFGLVAQCGGGPVVLRLPMPQSVDLERLRSARPGVAPLWDSLQPPSTAANMPVILTFRLGCPTP